MSNEWGFWDEYRQGMGDDRFVEYECDNCQWILIEGIDFYHTYQIVGLESSFPEECPDCEGDDFIGIGEPIARTERI